MCYCTILTWRNNANFDNEQQGNAKQHLRFFGNFVAVKLLIQLCKGKHTWTYTWCFVWCGVSRRLLSVCLCGAVIYNKLLSDLKALQTKGRKERKKERTNNEHRIKAKMIKHISYTHRTHAPPHAHAHAHSALSPHLPCRGLLLTHLNLVEMHYW